MRIYLREDSRQADSSKIFPFKEKRQIAAQRNSTFEKTIILLLILKFIQTCFKHSQFVPRIFVPNCSFMAVNDSSLMLKGFP
jgi:hypothetical protein